MKKTVLIPFVLIFLFGCHKDRPIVISGNQATFTIPANSIVLNPSGNAPLSALVKFSSPVSGHTEIVVKGKHGTASDISQVFNDSGTQHSIPVLGLYANYNNTIDIYVIDNERDTAKAVFNIKTAALTQPMPNYINVDVANLGAMEPGINLVSGFSNYPNFPLSPYILDSFGDIRWCLDFSKNPVLSNLYYDCGIDRLKDGNFRFVDAYTNKIYEVDILGKIINTWGLGQYTFHHDLYEMPNGNFLVTVNDPGSTHPNGVATIEDYVIEIDRNSDAILNVWDLKQSLNQYRQVLTTNSTDWVHANGLIYDASDNTIIVSGRVQGVFKLTFDNHVVWVLGPHRGWGLNNMGQDLSKLLLTPLDSTGTAITDTSIVNGWTNSPSFEWNWYQHSPQLIPNGDLMVFDNGQYRNYNTSALSGYSRAVEFKINQTNMTVQQIWEYGKERGTQTFSQIVSSVKYLPDTKHILFSPGYEVPNATGVGGKIVEVDYATKAVVFQTSVSSANSFGWHRVQRMSLYPNGNPYTP